MLLMRVVLTSTLCASSLAFIAMETYPLKFVYITVLSGVDLVVNIVEWVCDWGARTESSPTITAPSLMLSDLRGGGQLSESSESSESDTSGGADARPTPPSWDFGKADIVQTMFDKSQDKS